MFAHKIHNTTFENDNYNDNSTISIDEIMAAIHVAL